MLFHLEAFDLLHFREGGEQTFWSVFSVSVVSPPLGKGHGAPQRRESGQVTMRSLHMVPMVSEPPPQLMLG